jgi:ribosomal protein S18 acetylase RimI-like enzyme
MAARDVRFFNQAITIRKLHADDSLADLVELSKAFFAEYTQHEERFFEIDEVSDADVREYFGRSVDNENAATFVACLGERVIAYVTIFVREQPHFWAVKRVGSVSGLMVDPKYRRKGIGDQLLRQAIEFFRERSVCYFTAFTAVSNTVALRLYERHGMKPLCTTLLGYVDENATRPD